jgi:hypothetical protein
MTRRGACCWLMGCVLATLGAGTGMACATWGRAESRRESPPVASSTTVENRSGSTVLAHVSAGGIEWRLGALGPQDSRTFPLPSRVGRLETYRLVADPIDSGDRVVSSATPAAASLPTHFIVESQSIAAAAHARR